MIEKKQKLMVFFDDLVISPGFFYLLQMFIQENKDKESLLDDIPSKEKFFSWFINQNMYHHFSIDQDIELVLESLNEEYDLYIASSYLYKEKLDLSGVVVQQKMDYLNYIFPFISSEKYIFMEKQFFNSFPIIVSKKVENLKYAERKILLQDYHNLVLGSEMLSDDIEVACDWKDVKVKLLKR